MKVRIVVSICSTQINSTTWGTDDALIPSLLPPDKQPLPTKPSMSCKPSIVLASKGPSPLKLTLVGGRNRKSCMRSTCFWEGHIKESPGVKHWRILFSTNLREEEWKPKPHTDNRESTSCYQNLVFQNFPNMLFMNDHSSVTVSFQQAPGRLAGAN